MGERKTREGQQARAMLNTLRDKHLRHEQRRDDKSVLSIIILSSYRALSRAYPDTLIRRNIVFDTGRNLSRAAPSG